MTSHDRPRSPRRRTLGACAALAFAAAGLVTVGTTTEAAAESEESAERTLEQKVTLKGVLGHLRKLQEVADDSDDSRAAGDVGYDRSARYVFQRLRAAGYDVQYQDFAFDRFTVDKPTVFEQLAPTPATYEEATGFATAEYTGSGDVTGTVVDVDVVEPPASEANTSTSGCEPEDFAAFPAGGVALLQRGTCTFGVKSQNAAAAGAVGVILYNEGTPGDPERNELLLPTLAGSDVSIPVVSVNYELGRSLVGAKARIATDVTVSPDTRTRNVIAETPGGAADNVVLVGAHLDSVSDGPGINDNGTGVAAILEVAEQLAGGTPANKVRFAFWGAEEAGLLGSTQYVESLSEEERGSIALYLNFDMVGSPNYFRGVYDGDASQPGSVAPPEGSAAIEHLFDSYFTSRSLPFEDATFDARSDYQAFITAGIPAGGLFTGAEVEKTEEQVARYGGVVAPFDPCYHKACDSFTPRKDGADGDTYRALRKAYGSQLRGNVNLHALDTSADAIAFAVETYAADTSPVRGQVPVP
ncbi:MAG: M20/M25/M40 family metallo-hydrolase [Actinomycetes bacterium]